MTHPTLRVVADDDARQEGQLDAVLASLPVSLRPAARQPGDLVAVSGTHGWATRAVAAITQGASGLMVVNPVIDVVDELIEVAAAHATPVVIDRPFSSNPAIDQAPSWPARSADPYAVVESAITTSVATDLVRLALDQLSLIRRVATAVHSADPIVWDGSGYVLQGRLTDGRRTILTATITRAVDRSAWLRILGGTGAVELTVPDPATARAAHVTITTPHGATLLPTLFETAHRSAWRRLYRMASEASGRSSELEDLRADMKIAAGWSTPQTQT